MDLSRKLLKKYLMPQRSLKIYKQSQNVLVLLPQRSVVGEKKKKKICQVKGAWTSIEKMTL